LSAAAELLADALADLHLSLRAVARVAEDRVHPFLAEMSAARRDELAGLIARVLKQHLGPGDHREKVAGWESVLSFDFWYQPDARSPTVACGGPARDRAKPHRDRRPAGRIPPKANSRRKP
jgi:hypothetical protein